MAAHIFSIIAILICIGAFLIPIFGQIEYNKINKRIKENEKPLPVFQYGDKVKVKEGFYKDLKGKVHEYYRTFIDIDIDNGESIFSTTCKIKLFKDSEIVDVSPYELIKI